MFTRTGRARTVKVNTTPRRDTHVNHAAAPVRPGIDAQRPGSMPRAEDDDVTRANSPEFKDRPGSGKDTGRRFRFF